MAYIAMAYIVMALLARILSTEIVIAYIVIAYMVMAHIVVAFIDRALYSFGFAGEDVLDRNSNNNKLMKKNWLCRRGCPRPKCLPCPRAPGSPRSPGHISALYRLYLGIADGISIARVWACRYSK